MSTLKEPYRVEGKKTLGYELAEQLNWQLPDVILYPTGGGTGLIGMWKAFDEMEALGWIGKNGRGCSRASCRLRADRARVRSRRKKRCEFPEAHTIASGLRVPKAIGDFLILKILRESDGGAIAVDDAEMIRVAHEVGAREGLFICPEGAACFAALKLFAPPAKSRPVNASSFLTQGRESNILKLPTANDASDTVSHVRLPAKMEMRFANALDGSA